VRTVVTVAINEELQHIVGSGILDDDLSAA
jgi:hypothetical protein